jgi:hypothetical protein
MATKGTKWFLRRSVDLIPYLLFMAVREALIAPKDWASAPPGVPAASVTAGAPGAGAEWLPGIDETPEPVAE